MQTMLMELLSGVERDGGEKVVAQLVAPHPVQELFDPVHTCCSLGTKQFDHQHFLQHVQIT